MSVLIRTSSIGTALLIICHVVPRDDTAMSYSKRSSGPIPNPVSNLPLHNTEGVHPASSSAGVTTLSISGRPRRETVVCRLNDSVLAGHVTRCVVELAAKELS
jgi:hypothetical protein